MIWVTTPSRTMKARESPMWASTILSPARSIAMSVVPMPSRLRVGVHLVADLGVGAVDAVEQGVADVAAAERLAVEAAPGRR